MPHRRLICAVVMSLFLLPLLASLAAAQELGPPGRLRASPIQVASGDPVDIYGTGFTPGREVISHLRRPDQTEYAPLRFLINERGEFFHDVDTLLLDEGTHELWVIDQTTKTASNAVRFTVGFHSRPPQVAEALGRFTGVWRGSGQRNAPLTSSSVLISITGENAGAVAGTIAYPELSCGGVLTFRSIDVNELELVETLSYGTARCPHNGRIIVKTTNDATLDFEWRHSSLPGVGTGKLTPLKE